jgi:protein TonB
MEDTARVRDRLIMAILISAVIHLIVILGPLGPAPPRTETVTTHPPLALDVQPSHSADAPSLRLLAGPGPGTRAEPADAEPAPRAIDGTEEDAARARYLRDWIVHTETLGNRAYPAELINAGIRGRVVMAITLNADGEVRAARIIGGSDNPVLRRAARSLVEAAAPYPPVPAAVLDDRDTLVITRSWSFGRD